MPSGAIKKYERVYPFGWLGLLFDTPTVSWWMTMMLHTFPDSPFDQKMQLAEPEYLFRSRAAATAFAENYVGLPFF